MGDEAPTDAELVHAYRARNLPSWLLLQTARAKHDDVPTFRVRNAIRKLEKTDTYPVPVLESVEAFENMADNRHVAQMSCVLPAPLAVVLYQRDPDFIADWFTWQEQIANG